jgi:uncharacterized membrane protein YeaQ/YmgE (transglycosylase-associated protein family)
MLFPQILHFIGMGAIGAFLAILVWAKEAKELYSFDALKSLCIGAIVGYLYSLLYENYSFPDLIMACVAGYFGKDFVEAFFEKLKQKLFT